MTDSITTQIVGAHFRPPAKALLSCLPAGHQLWLRPEPTNEWDENAVQVLLRSASLRSLLTEPFIRDELERQLSGQGSDIESVLVQPEWHLGYLPRAAKGNKELEEWNIGVQQAVHEICRNADFEDDCTDNPQAQVACFLSFDSAGKPTCIIPWPPVPTAHSDGIADGSLPQAGGLPESS